VQSAFGCGFEGVVDPERVLTIVRRYLEAGLRNISLADTAGHAHPFQVKHLVEKILSLDADIEFACHFHNTYGMGMANTFAAMELGIRCFESSVAGLGGCPFTKVAAGNVCTEDFVHILQRTGARTDINLAKLIELANDMASYFRREMPGHVYKTGPVQSTVRNS
jgi:hydroxymethylglutaryl-CoA lyase